MPSKTYSYCWLAYENDNQVMTGVESDRAYQLLLTTPLVIILYGKQALAGKEL
jgi:hypothetical protein